MQDDHTIDSSQWHALAVDAVLNTLDTSAEGLVELEAIRRLRTYGPNRVAGSARRGVMRRFLLQFHNVLIYVLIASAAVTAALGHVIDTLVIIAVVVANALIGFFQEGKAEKAMDAIRQMLAPNASVWRDGQRKTVAAEALVPGDIVLLEPGDKVPADLRLLQSQGLQIQEAILTGESLPVEKHTQPVPAEFTLGDRTCMAFSGTLVTSGSGRGVVVSIGANTEIGRISGMLARVDSLTTPLLEQMSIFARWLTGVILLVAALLLVFGYYVQHLELSDMFMAVVGLSVAAIPEGLPAVLTITLAVGVQAMARRNAIIRRLPAIETLGSVSVICTDKTGTLTRNEMLAATAVTSEHTFTFDGTGYQPSGAVKLDCAVVTGSDDAVLRELGRVAALCNDASLHLHDGKWVVEGDPMEGALLALSAKIGIDQQQIAGWVRTDAIPFDAKHRYMATLNHGQNDALILVKGAPEQILSMCRAQRSAEDGSGPLDMAYWQRQADHIAGQGQRVLAFAIKTVPVEQTTVEPADVEASLTLIGLVGLIDPPRPEAIQAIAECRRAGICVHMITGDHRGTAAAIGRQIGLRNPDRVLTGADLDALDDAALSSVVAEIDIFARTSPEHKLRLVMALQAAGMTVAMTGDGVNDAPALKRADAGIAMGLNGSEASKEAADFVLADDNFATIVAAVKEGRTVYDNIKKVISWTLPTSTGEAMTIVVALLFGMSLPITPIQILWINLITATTLGMALAFERTEPGTMGRPPRPRNQPLLGAELAWHTVLVSILFIIGVFGIYRYAINQGHSIELARTMAVNTLVVMEIFHLFFIRNIYGTSLTWEAVRATKVVWATVIIVSLAQVAITYLPMMQKIFATEAVPLVDGLYVIGIGILLFVIIEVEKQLRLRWRAQRQA